jgi:hypothetical protein
MDTHCDKVTPKMHCPAKVLSITIVDGINILVSPCGQNMLHLEQGWMTCIPAALL